MKPSRSCLLAFVFLSSWILRSAPAASVPAAEDDLRRDATVVAVEKVMPSVVNITARSIVSVHDPFEELYRLYLGQQPTASRISLGSGVIIDEAGYLLTNDHVVSRAVQIGVQFNAGTNVYYEATIVARDPKRDLALLKLNARPGEKFHAIQFAREDDLLLGETVVALGNPFGLGGSVTRGILSSKSRNMPKEGALLDIPNWLQTDAPINPGNSGGPLVNLRGELIGINVAVLNEYAGQPVQGIGFAIPIKLIEEALSNILPTEYVKSFWFGAHVKVGASPLVIASVQPESPAGRAGLKPGDAILQVNGRTPRSFIDFADLLAANAGSDIALAVQRGTFRSAVTVRLVPEKSVFNAELIRSKIGLSLENRSDGFAITGVQSASPADDAGLQRGMLVTAVDGQAPADVTELAKLLYAKKKGESALLYVTTVQRIDALNVLRQFNVAVAVR